MPKVETIIDDIGNDLRIINLDNSVGANGVNSPHDVMVVKALLQLAVGSNRFGIPIKISELPEAFDGTTYGMSQLIKRFQKYAGKLLSKYGHKVVVDGRIRPAKGHAVNGKSYSTIVALNVFANTSGGIGNPNGETDQIYKLKKTYPHLNDHFKINGIAD